MGTLLSTAIPAPGATSALSAPVTVVVLALGAVGVYLSLPGGRAELGRTGLLLAAIVAGVLLAFAATSVAPVGAPGWFVAIALVALFAAVRVITHRRPVYSALYFVLLVVAVAGLLILMQAGFVAIALLIVYAGAILVTYLFVIMLAQQAHAAGYDAKSREPFWGATAGFVLLTTLAVRMTAGPAAPPAEAVSEAAGSVQAVGTPLLTTYLIAIQMVGVLLLAAMVGAIAIARRDVVADSPTAGAD